MLYERQVGISVQERTGRTAALGSPIGESRPDHRDDGDEHGSAWAAFEGMLATRSWTRGPDGRCLLVHSRSGQEASRLLQSFRRHVHYRELGGCVSARLGCGVDDSGRFLLGDVIESSEQPYRESAGDGSLLLKLSNAIVCDPTLVDPQLLERFRSCEDEDDARRYANRISTRLYLDSERFLDIDPDLVKALIYLQRESPLVHRLVRRYLRCEVLGRLDRRALGDIVPRTEDGDPRSMVEQLGRAVSALLGGPFVLCVGQEGAEPGRDAFRRGIRFAGDVADRLPTSLVVVACDQATWDRHHGFLTRRVARWFEADPGPVVLGDRAVGKRNGNGVSIHSSGLLRHVLGRRGMGSAALEEIEPAHATDDSRCRAGALIRREDAPTRGAVSAVLPELRADGAGDAGSEQDGPAPAPSCESKEAAERAIDPADAAAREVVIEPTRGGTESYAQEIQVDQDEASANVEPGGNGRHPAEAEPDATHAHLSDAWRDGPWRKRARAPKKAETRLELVAAALEIAALEAPSPRRIQVRAVDSRSLEVTLLDEGARRIGRVHATEEALKNGVLMRRIERIARESTDGAVVLLRGSVYPGGANRTATVLDEKRASGWRLLTYDEAELRELQAIRRFAQANGADSALCRWLASERPVQASPLIAAILEAIETSKPVPADPTGSAETRRAGRSKEGRGASARAEKKEKKEKKAAKSERKPSRSRDKAAARVTARGRSAASPKRARTATSRAATRSTGKKAAASTAKKKTNRRPAGGKRRASRPRGKPTPRR